MRHLNNFVPEQVVTHLTPREQDFTLPKDSDDITSTQKEYLQKELGLSAAQIFYGRQTHGNRVVVVKAEDVPLKIPIEQADAFVTSVPGIALGVRTADCLPIFLYDSAKHVIGMVHAGWRGTEKKIAVAAVETMAKTYGTQATDVLVAFGPCLRRCCYKVGPEFGDSFPDETFVQFGTYFFDLALANRNQLLELGVNPEHIADEGLCTSCREDLFPTAGRANLPAGTCR